MLVSGSRDSFSTSVQCTVYTMYSIFGFLANTISLQVIYSYQSCSPYIVRFTVLPSSVADLNPDPDPHVSLCLDSYPAKNERADTKKNYFSF